MKIYLEMKETGLPINTDIGVSIRVEATSNEEATQIRDELAARFFVGKTHEDKVHTHYEDKSCEAEILP